MASLTRRLMPQAEKDRLWHEDFKRVCDESLSLLHFRIAQKRRAEAARKALSPQPRRKF